MRLLTFDDFRETASALERDRAYTDGIRDAFFRSGLADLLSVRNDDSKSDPYRPMPANWTAIELAVFDNGPMGPKRKRPKLQRTQLRHGGQIKLWTRETIKFADRKGVDWRANFYLWSAEEARAIVSELQVEGKVTSTTVEAMETLTEKLGSDWMFAVPTLKIGPVSRWMRDHLIAAQVGENGKLEQLLIIAEQEMRLKVTRTDFADHLANGDNFTGQTVQQLRATRGSRFELWSTIAVD